MIQRPLPIFGYLTNSVNRGGAKVSPLQGGTGKAERGTVKKKGLKAEGRGKGQKVAGFLLWGSKEVEDLPCWNR